MNTGMIGKIQQTIITRKRKFLQLLEHGSYSAIDYVHVKRRACKDLEIKNIGEYHDFYLQSN